jgi:hypothetical protein
MAVRKDGLHSERVRKRIQLSQLVTRLQNNALGKVDMTPGQIDSAKFLISKAMPNLPETKVLAGDPSAPLKHAVEFHIVDHRPSDKG